MIRNVPIPAAIVDAVRRDTAARISELDQRLRAMFAQQGAGCRGIAEPPRRAGGRGLFLKHEFPRPPLLLRLLGVRVRCYCGDTTTW